MQTSEHDEPSSLTMMELLREASRACESLANVHEQRSIDDRPLGMGTPGRVPVDETIAIGLRKLARELQKKADEIDLVIVQVDQIAALWLEFRGTVPT